MIRVSVAMAAFNGEKYIQQQIDSIISQLQTQDELIISYNESTDDTLEIISRYEDCYSNVKVVACEEKGVIANFNNAIQQCSGDVIFLADQDDIWLPTKVISVLECMKEKNVDLVVHDCEIVDVLLNSYGYGFFEKRSSHKGKIYNWCKNSYQGCCMAFKANLINKICPIPRDIAMHDQWIGLIAEYTGKVFFLEKKLILYRRHEQAVTTGKFGFNKKVLYMLNMAKRLKQRLL